MGDTGLHGFIDEVLGEGHLRVEEELGGGFVRLRTSEAERRQAQQDIRCVEDIVLELLRNARDAGARMICIATNRDGRMRNIVAIDDGEGIPPQMWQKVFEPRVTSKLDTFHADQWGVHGRGMALYSIACNAADKGIFVLVKTSNPSSGELQDKLVDGRPVYLRVADLVSEWGKDSMGELGYSRVCAVVGATHPEEGERAREALPHTFFLVPGYGAQGGKAEDIRRFFDKDGRGCIVNSSRGIIAAYRKSEKYGEKDFAAAARDAAIAMQKDLLG